MQHSQLLTNRFTFFKESITVKLEDYDLDPARRQDLEVASEMPSKTRMVQIFALDANPKRVVDAE